MVPKNHPLREIKKLADAALRDIEPVLDEMYATRGRPSVPPERLLKSMLLMALHSVRSDRHLCEQVGYNLLFRWFLDMTMMESSWDPTTFTKNRERLMEHDVASLFFSAVTKEAARLGLTSADHFSVDGTLIEAWASMKSFRPKGEAPARKNGWADFRGTRRSNATHESTTDREARLMRKGSGKEAKLSFSGHALMENRNGLVLDFLIEEANGTAERDAALLMLDKHRKQGRRTLAADRGYDVQSFVTSCRERSVTPHVARRKRSSGIDARTTRHEGYLASQKVRKRIEQVFGWLKTVAGLRRTRFKGPIF